MTEAPRDPNAPFTDQEILEAFTQFDLDANKFVGAAEIRHVLINIGENAMRYVYHTSLDTKRYTGIQPNGRTAIEIFFWTTFCLECKGEEIDTGIIEDVAAAA